MFKNIFDNIFLLLYPRIFFSLTFKKNIFFANLYLKKMEIRNICQIKLGNIEKFWILKI